MLNRHVICAQKTDAISLHLAVSANWDSNCTGTTWQFNDQPFINTETLIQFFLKELKEKVYGYPDLIRSAALYGYGGSRELWPMVPRDEVTSITIQRRLTAWAALTRFLSSAASSLIRLENLMKAVPRSELSRLMKLLPNLSSAWL